MLREVSRGTRSTLLYDDAERTFHRRYHDTLATSPPLATHWDTNGVERFHNQRVEALIGGRVAIRAPPGEGDETSYAGARVRKVPAHLRNTLSVLVRSTSGRGKRRIVSQRAGVDGVVLRQQGGGDVARRRGGGEAARLPSPLRRAQGGGLQGESQAGHGALGTVLLAARRLRVEVPDESVRAPQAGAVSAAASSPCLSTQLATLTHSLDHE